MSGPKEFETSNLPYSHEESLLDYQLAYQSRQVSLVGQREVMSGRAKFGIFGAGKELVQIAIASVFKKGDFRSGYYRDQTLMFAIGGISFADYFAQLYAHTSLDADPSTAGRIMTGHFSTRSVDSNGEWKTLTELQNSSADISPTGAQMPRLVGLAYASRLYRELEELKHLTKFSNDGNEIAFGTIGNAACAEGIFWESINAIGVLKAPAVISIYDDDYGISVTNENAMVKQNMFELLRGFQREAGSNDGYDLYTVKGWDYPSLLRTYLKATELTRQEHIPAIIHVTELTQPLGHSTSGSHERYKPEDRLTWEREFDCNSKFRQWILNNHIATLEELELLEKESLSEVEESRKKAWMAYTTPVLRERKQIAKYIDQIAAESNHLKELEKIKTNLLNIPYPFRRDFMVAIRDVLITTKEETIPEKQELIIQKQALNLKSEDRYCSHTYSEWPDAAQKIPEIEPVYSEQSPLVNGFEVLNACFDAALRANPRVIAFGEDVGKLGDVNQAFRGLQSKYGELRVSDTGIREATIVGQAIGMALRGLRPIAEIQYLDYLLYALQTMADDLATLLWRTKGGQKAPAIIRTRGHRLEGVWHAGSPMAGIIHLVRGMHVLVPRDMTQAAGFYNTMLQAEEPCLIVEVLNGYRIKERLPDNIGEFTTPVGIPEVIQEGTDITLVTYGACCRIVLQAAKLLGRTGIEAEVVDVRSLLPFDVNMEILNSLKKTNRIIFIDEDVPGGTTAFMMQEVLEKQGGYTWLDSPPRTVSGKHHRPAYSTDGDYWSKPNIEEVFETAYEVMNEIDPETYPIFFK